jgi:5'-nucleotidase / UDP-sugar diphosphatase
MVRSTRRFAAIVLLGCCSLFAEVRGLTILHINDLHAHLSPLDSKRGGFAYLATAIRRERAGCQDCILLNAGDLAQGTPVSTIFHGMPVFEIANLLGIDAATLGNHDFDYGWMQTRKFMSVSRYPIVSANIAGGRGELFTREPYVILNVNGLRVAVLGAMTDTLDSLSLPKLLGEWHTTPVVETVRKYAKELRAKSDLIVLLAHITGREELEILSGVSEIPVTVSGHLHVGLPQALNQEGRLVVRVKGYGEELGRLDLKVDTVKKAPVSWTWRHIPVDSSELKPAEDVAHEVQHWEEKVSERVDRPLAVAKHSFSNGDVKVLIERAMREETGADFAFMNAGGVRDILPEGQLRERNIWNIMPFDNRVVTGIFRGKDLPRVVLDGRTVEPNRSYTLAVSDFTAANQGTKENLGVTGLKFPHDAGLMRDVLIDWFRKKKVIE